MNFPLAALLLGIGATAITDLWSFIRKALLDVPMPNFAVGRRTMSLESVLGLYCTAWAVRFLS